MQIRDSPGSQNFVALQLPVAAARSLLRPKGSPKGGRREARCSQCCGFAQEVTPAVLKTPSTLTPGNGHEEGCIRLSLQDSPHTPLCVSSGASCCGWMNIFGRMHVFSGHSFIAVPVMAGNCRCLFSLTLGHLAKLSLSGHADASQ